MDMDYSLIIEKAKFIFLVAFIMGIFIGWCMRELDTFCNFIYKSIRKYVCFKRLKK